MFPIPTAAPLRVRDDETSYRNQTREDSGEKK